MTMGLHLFSLQKTSTGAKNVYFDIQLQWLDSSSFPVFNVWLPGTQW